MDRKKSPEVYEEIGRDKVELSKSTKYKEDKKLLLNHAYYDFREAGRLYEKAGNLKRAEVMHRMAGKIGWALKIKSSTYDVKSAHKDHYQTSYARMLHERKKSPLETAAATTALLTLLAGIFFLSYNFSNTIQMSPGASSSNWPLSVGVVLLTIAFIAGFFWMKEKMPLKTISRKIIHKKVSKKKKR